MPQMREQWTGKRLFQRERHTIKGNNKERMPPYRPLRRMLPQGVKYPLSHFILSCAFPKFSCSKVAHNLQNSVLFIDINTYHSAIRLKHFIGHDEHFRGIIISQFPFSTTVLAHHIKLVVSAAVIYPVSQYWKAGTGKQLSVSLVLPLPSVRILMHQYLTRS